MAILLVELPGTRRGSVLPRRVLIGRRPMNHLVIDHPGVSRLHAWIDGEGDRYYISDAGSRTGTRVNGQRVVARHLLGDGDEITLGPAKLTFLAESRVRDGVEALDLSAEPAGARDGRGILFDCPSCTAPLWANNDFAGRTGQCKYCGNEVTVPRTRRQGHSDAHSHAHSHSHSHSHGDKPAGRHAGVAAPVPKARTVDQTCGVCQSPISIFEEQTSCPSCGLVFHAECWAENYGCSAYGCSQVNALKPPDAPEAHSSHGEAGGSFPAGGDAAGASTGTYPADAPNRFPWEFLLLAGSVFSALLGALTFGLPSLALAGGSVAYIARTRRGGGDDAVRPNRGVVLLSTGLAVLGMFTGAALSYYIYFGSSHS